MRKEDYKSLVDKYKQESKKASDVEIIRIQKLALEAPGPVEKALDDLITQRAKIGNYVLECDFHRLDYIWSFVHKEVPFKNREEAYKTIIQICINFCEREGLKYDRDTFTISWDN